MAEAEAQLHVLVLGGTQFMGRLMVEALLAAGHHVTMSNRGKSPNPFASDARVTLLRCDRMGDRERFVSLVAAASDDQPFDVVIDFTGFHRDTLRDTIKALHNVSENDVSRKVGHYIYVSTDSVYMGSVRPFPSLRVGSGMRAGHVGEDGEAERLLETDCVLPSHREQRSVLKRWNSYQCREPCPPHAVLVLPC